ncbi:hypothetical protein ANCCAN_08389 [Ancylostoma caninum]|uniref:EF-hand domain-containing protein n=1 Tax=Ancylostoma caninum TaxID=29170 RepID=A0A368GMJ3_ANCCA|nr:hypothetical protein ANCCAN_08389 [Ancylostoma caninum]
MNLEDVIDMFPDIEPFLIRKWHYAFYTFFDIIGNDVIEWRDFQQLIDAIGAVRGVGGEDHIAARISLTDVWHSMCETMNKDYKEKEEHLKLRISSKESADWEREHGHQVLELEVLEMVIAKIFACPRDQLVDLSEYVEVLGYFSIPREDAIACFDKFAVNPEGGQFNSIDYKTFLSLWRQYFHSTDINDAGNHLLGTP